MDKNELENASFVEIVDESYRRDPNNKTFKCLRMAALYMPDCLIDKEASSNPDYEYKPEESYGLGEEYKPQGHEPELEM